MGKTSLKTLAITAAIALGTVSSLALNSGTAFAADEEKADNPFASMAPRQIGPAHPSGRISDFAVHPDMPNVYYAAIASGGIWKTGDNGISWKPVFDKYGSYAVGNIEMDPNNPNILWAGTGENNSQRSVANGDGIYKTEDGGKSWKNMGLKDSGHLSTIWINPADSNHLRVAAQGPLWNSGGDRGLYETMDGGKSWNRILEIDEDTGVNEFVVDPANPDIMVASSYQRRRHLWTLINGGPGSAVHRTTDGGKTWTKVKSGLPGGDLGRIGLAAAPSNPSLIYAIIEAGDKDKGVYASTDSGASWSKRSSHMTTSPQYYNELFVDPVDPDVLYSVDTWTNVSRDGGRTWTRLSTEMRHVDDHAMWINPKNTSHMLIGGDGGIYETFDGGTKWRHINNLPIVQFYRITPDNDAPFYNVCGGTQDNNSLCGPSRTTYEHGILNEDWPIILGGDGYKAVTDPTDPNIVYTQYQYGGLARYDKRTTETVFIAPHPASGENDYKWNWNTPILISPHKSTRLYYAAEKLFVSEDRGDNWRAISPDLTRQIDRNALKVMGRVWSENAIAKNDSTSMWGSIIGLDESVLQEGLIYVGTDDGLIHVTENGGESWQKTDKFKGVPSESLVEDVIASVHNPNVAYAVFDNHKRGDFKPYVMRTDNRGKSWKMISGNLPERGTVHTIAEDHEDPNLLFVGTEYGLFFTQDGGDVWHQVKGGFPTISVRDIEIQRRESDLVIGTFGRGVYILDDYSPLRTKASDLAEDKATLFSVKDAWQYIEASKYSGHHGDQFWSTENPPYGAIFSYHLREGLMTDKETRLKAEAAKEKEGEDTPYPSFDILRAEDREEKPSVVLTVKDASGAVVRRIKGKTGKGLHRVAWDLREEGHSAASLDASGDPAPGPEVLPGTYSVSLEIREKGSLTEVGSPQSFTVKSLKNSPEVTDDLAALQAFRTKVTELRKAVTAANAKMGDINKRIKYLDVALMRTPKADESHVQRLNAIRDLMQDASVMMQGDRSVSSRNEPSPMSVSSRISRIGWGSWGSRAPTTGMHKRSYAIAEQEFGVAMAKIANAEADLSALEAEAVAAGAPYTPGTMPNWQPQ